jgi:hypothetical protein
MKRYCVQQGGPDWSRADLLTDFTFAWENRLSPKTGFRAVHDTTHLHFRFDCLDDDLVLPNADSEMERVLGSDRVEIFFAPDLSLQPYYCLEMSPRGEVLAYKARFYREMDWDWSCDGLEIDAKIRDDGYSVTGRIPLATLRVLDVLRGHEMHAGLYRAEFHHKPDGTVHAGWMPWVNPGTSKPDFHLPESFGMLHLAGLEF